MGGFTNDIDEVEVCGVDQEGRIKMQNDKLRFQKKSLQDQAGKIKDQNDLIFEQIGVIDEEDDD